MKTKAVRLYGESDLRLEEFELPEIKENEILAIDNVNFTIKEGEFVSIIGPSGCGKSTLLSIIAGLEEKSSGEIYIEDKKIDEIE